jgi:hypothetical protein
MQNEKDLMLPAEYSQRIQDARLHPLVPKPRTTAPKRLLAATLLVRSLQYHLII